MTTLLIGLLLFLGAHSVRIVAEDWRQSRVDRWGELPFKGLVAIISVVGLWLMVTGYQQARLSPVLLWSPPVATRHVASLLMWFSWVLMVAAYLPGNHFKARLRHPMVISVKVWALAHLLANGLLHQMVLFGAILVWAVFNFRAARRRDQNRLSFAPPRSGAATVAVLVLGTVIWAAFISRLHLWLIGVSPLGM
jgi:uncharacterized membrane protein